MTPEERLRRLTEAANSGRRVADRAKRSVKAAQQEARDQGAPPPTDYEVIGRAIWDHEQREFGSRPFSVEGEPYILDGVGRDALMIDLKDPYFTAWLSTRYGLIKGDKLTHFVTQFIADRVRHYNLRPVRLHKFSHYDVVNNRLYVNANDGMVWRITGDGPPQLVMNGQDDIYFHVNRTQDTREVPVSLSDIDIGPHGMLHPMLIDDLSYATDGKVSATVMKHVFAAWICGIAFAELMTDGRPLLLVDGPPNSGKTLALSRICTLFTGYPQAKILSDKGEDSFPSQALHSVPIFHIDNADRFIDWLPDKLAAYATGAGFAKRKHNENDALHIVKPNCFIAVSSADPKSFRRFDLTQRTRFIKLAPQTQAAIRDPSEMVREVQRDRKKLLGEWVYILSNMVAALPGIRVTNPASRLPGFERVFQTYLRAMGLDGAEEELKMAIAEQVQFSAEEDPGVDMVYRWMEKRTNRGRQLSVTTLWEELGELSGTGALNMETPFTKVFKTANTFGKWLKNEAKVKLESKGILLQTWVNASGKAKDPPFYSFDMLEDD